MCIGAIVAIVSIIGVVAHIASKLSENRQIRLRREEEMFQVRLQRYEDVMLNQKEGDSDE